MWKYCKICCVSITIYIKGKKKVQTEDWKKKNIYIYINIYVATVVTVPLGTVVTVPLKKKDKVPHWTVQTHRMNSDQTL